MAKVDLFAEIERMKQIRNEIEEEIYQMERMLAKMRNRYHYWDDMADIWDTARVLSGLEERTEEIRFVLDMKHEEVRIITDMIGVLESFLPPTPPMRLEII